VEATSPLLKPVQTVKLPLFLRNKFLQTIAVAVVYICCAISSGPLISFPTMVTDMSLHRFDQLKVPLLIKAGVFGGSEEHLTLMYTLAIGTAAALFFFTGFAYDWLGAQWCGVIGAGFVSVGFFSMAAGIKWQSFNNVLYFAFPWTYVFGVFNSFSVFGFVWFFPK
jgi:hypothetical protein